MDTTITAEKKAAFKEKEGNESFTAGKKKRDRKNKELETKQTRTNSSSPMLIFLSSLVQKTWWWPIGTPHQQLCDLQQSQVSIGGILFVGHIEVLTFPFKIYPFWILNFPKYPIHKRKISPPAQLGIWNSLLSSIKVTWQRDVNNRSHSIYYPTAIGKNSKYLTCQLKYSLQECA